MENIKNTSTMNTNTENASSENLVRFTKVTTFPSSPFTVVDLAAVNSIGRPAAYARIQKHIRAGKLCQSGKVESGKKGKPATLFATI
jgi:hypothetical protein